MFYGGIIQIYNTKRAFSICNLTVIICLRHDNNNYYLNLINLYHI